MPTTVLVAWWVACFDFEVTLMYIFYVLTIVLHCLGIVRVTALFVVGVIEYVSNFTG